MPEYMACKYKAAIQIIADSQIMRLWMTPKMKEKTFHTMESMCTTKMVEQKNE